MTVFLADDFTSIASERARMRREEGLRDDNWKTANGGDLDALAAGYEIYRTPFESDYALRGRVEKAADLIRSKHFIYG
jgi:hypothetical protein